MGSRENLTTLLKQRSNRMTYFFKKGTTFIRFPNVTVNPGRRMVSAVRKKKKKRYKSGVRPLKVIYNNGRGKKEQQEVVSHYRPPSCLKPNTC